MKKIFLYALKFYKMAISPVVESLLGKGCKYEKTCSEYAIESVGEHGVVRGSRLALIRILSCNSWGSKQ